ncbi:unnamed protein product [Calicophoron daubneyi]|uniref:Uncharacterized protein n=1 Tax=Calicophoron daubneyi TaxID=300641 RepID=A0AAV2TQ32_CALDB
MLKRKTSRRSSAQYYISAEDHVENEVKHERLLTETSRLSSSWAGLTVSGGDPAEGDCSSLPASANNSPSHRPHSFSGPLVISVTCSSSCSGLHSCCPNQSLTKGIPTSPTPNVLSSGHPSPVSSPVSSRVQCYSPGLGAAMNSPTSRRPNNGGASPLLVSAALCRKRGYLSCMMAGGASSDDANQEGPPDTLLGTRGNKAMRQGDCRPAFLTELSQFRWPPGPSLSSNPPSPSCHLFPSTQGTSTAHSSPSTSSLPSPRLSLSSTTVFPGSPTLSTGTCPTAPAMDIQSASGSPPSKRKTPHIIMDTESKTVTAFSANPCDLSEVPVNKS